MVAAMLVASSVFGGLKEARRNYEKKLKALRVEYVKRLKIERSHEIRRGNPISSIDAEIKRVKLLVKPFKYVSYRIKYSTGIRHYQFLSPSIIYWREGRMEMPYKRKDDIIIIIHPKGETETWEKKDNAWRVLFAKFKRDIRGEAKKI